MKKLVLIISFIAFTILIHAQGAVEALQYSRFSPGGTARFIGMNGAFGALGGDFSVLSTNPAGIGLYRSSEFSITPSFTIGNTNSTFLNQDGSDYKVNFNLGNIGMIFAKDIPSRTGQNGWKFIQFGIGINRLNDFNNRVIIIGDNANNSLLDVYSAYATDFEIPAIEIEEDLYYDYAYDLNPAWWTYLLDTIGGPANYVNPIIKDGVTQSLSISKWGSMNEFVMTIGGNYSDIIYIGATLGIPFIRYYEESNYREEVDPANVNINDLRYFNIYRKLQTNATGINAKFGIIVKPVNWLRIGGSIHTPTFYSSVRDKNITIFDSKWRTPDLDGYTTYTKRNAWPKEYELTTPFRASGSLAFIIGPYGLISGDYEFINYSFARMRAVPTYVNDDIKNSYTSTHNFRIGTEWRYNIFSIRAGYGYQPSPYKSNINDGVINTYTGGVGLKVQNIYIDIAYSRSEMSEDYYLYSYDIYTAKSVNQTAISRILFTLGARF